MKRDIEVVVLPSGMLLRLLMAARMGALGNASSEAHVDNQT